MPAIRSQVLEVIREAYPETGDAVTPTEPLGENLFIGPTPHPNEVLNLLIQQKVTSALPMAYYMAARRGVDSLMDKGLPKSSMLSAEVLQSAVKGVVALRELELNEAHRFILGTTDSHPCCCKAKGPRASDFHQKAIDRIVNPSQSGTRVLRVLSLNDICGGGPDEFCVSCVNRWEAEHAEVREKAWKMLPEVFGLDSPICTASSM